MSFLRPMQRYHSQADPIWPDGTFNRCVNSFNFLYSSWMWILLLYTKISNFASDVSQYKIIFLNCLIWHLLSQELCPWWWGWRPPPRQSWWPRPAWKIRKGQCHESFRRLLRYPINLLRVLNSSRTHIIGRCLEALLPDKKKKSWMIIEEGSRSKIICADEAPSNRRKGQKIKQEEKFCSFLTFPDFPLLTLRRYSRHAL